LKYPTLDDTGTWVVVVGPATPDRWVTDTDMVVPALGLLLDWIRKMQLLLEMLHQDHLRMPINTDINHVAGVVLVS